MSPLLLVLWLHYAHAFWRPQDKQQQLRDAKEIEKQTAKDTATFLEACRDKKVHSMILDDVCFWCTCENARKATCRSIPTCESSAKAADALVLPKNHTRLPRSPSLMNHKKIDFPQVMNLVKGPSAPNANCSPSSKAITIGCPPKDWCKGCTICDCQKNGKWDCNILSYCPGKTNKPTEHLTPDFRKRQALGVMFSTFVRDSTPNPRSHNVKKNVLSKSVKLPKSTLQTKLEIVDKNFSGNNTISKFKKQLLYQKKIFKDPSNELTFKHRKDQYIKGVLENKLEINTNSKNTRPDQIIHKNCGNNNKTTEIVYNVMPRGSLNLGPKNFNNSHMRENIRDIKEVNTKAPKTNFKRGTNKNIINTTARSAEVINKIRAKREVAEIAGETWNANKQDMASHTKLHLISDFIPNASPTVRAPVTSQKRQHRKLNFIENTAPDKFYYGATEPRRRRKAVDTKKKTDKYNVTETCEPVVSSYSVGCPAENWCTGGCVICDCTVKKQWNCYILSFCPDGKGGNFMIKQATKHKPLADDEKMSPGVPLPILDVNQNSQPNVKTDPDTLTTSDALGPNNQRVCENDTLILESQEEISDIYEKIMPKVAPQVYKDNLLQRSMAKDNHDNYGKLNVNNINNLGLYNSRPRNSLDALIGVTKASLKKGKRKGKKARINFEDEKLPMHKYGVKNKKIRLDKQSHPKVKTFLNPHGLKNKRKELPKLRVKSKIPTKPPNRTLSRTKRGLRNVSSSLLGTLPYRLNKIEETLLEYNTLE